MYLKNSVSLFIFKGEYTHTHTINMKPGSTVFVYNLLAKDGFYDSRKSKVSVFEKGS